MTAAQIARGLSMSADGDLPVILRCLAGRDIIETVQGKGSRLSLPAPAATTNGVYHKGGVS